MLDLLKRRVRCCGTLSKNYCSVKTLIDFVLLSTQPALAHSNKLFVPRPAVDLNLSLSLLLPLPLSAPRLSLETIPWALSRPLNLPRDTILVAYTSCKTVALEVGCGRVDGIAGYSIDRPASPLSSVVTIDVVSSLEVGWAVSFRGNRVHMGKFTVS